MLDNIIQGKNELRNSDTADFEWLKNVLYINPSYFGDWYKKSFGVNELVQVWNEWKIWECPTNALNFYSCLGDVYIQTSLIFLDFNVISPGLRINIFFGFYDIRNLTLIFNFYKKLRCSLSTR